LEDSQFARLLDFLGYSWRGYRRVRKGAKKRVARHMQKLGCRDLVGYLGRLATDPEARAECERRMAVSISRFFRDLGLWRDLYERVLPELMARDKSRIAVWLSGCACGEEVYSLAILVREYERAKGLSLPAEMIATDMDPVCLKRARRGVYPAGALRDVDEERRARWFTPEGDGFAVVPELGKRIHWHLHNALTEPPPAKELDLVFLRNSLLTYCRAEIADRPVRRITESLAPGGFLVIGATETLPDWAGSCLRPYRRSVYRKSVEPGDRRDGISASIRLYPGASPFCA